MSSLFFFQPFRLFYRPAFPDGGALKNFCRISRLTFQVPSLRHNKQRRLCPSTIGTHHRHPGHTFPRKSLSRFFLLSFDLFLRAHSRPLCTTSVQTSYGWFSSGLAFLSDPGLLLFFFHLPLFAPPYTMKTRIPALFFGVPAQRFFPFLSLFSSFFLDGHTPPLGLFLIEAWPYRLCPFFCFPFWFQTPSSPLPMFSAPLRSLFFSGGLRHS